MHVQVSAEVFLGRVYWDNGILTISAISKLSATIRIKCLKWSKSQPTSPELHIQHVSMEGCIGYLDKVVCFAYSVRSVFARLSYTEKIISHTDT